MNNVQEKPRLVFSRLGKECKPMPRKLEIKLKELKKKLENIFRDKTKILDKTSHKLMIMVHLLHMFY